MTKPDESQPSFSELWRESYALMRSKHYRAAIEIAQTCLELFPDKSFYIVLHLAALHAADGDLGAALTIFSDGVKDGHWYTPEILELTYPDVFTPMLDVMSDISDRWAELRSEEEARSKADPIITYPPDHHPEARTPLFLGFHGSGETAAYFKQHWHNSELEQEFVCAYPQSSCLCAPGQPAWDDRKKRHNDIAATLDLVIHHNRIGLDPSIVGGFSQGGGIALEYVLRNSIGISNCIALCPTVPSIEPEDIPLVGVKLQVFFILGAKDTAVNERVQNLASVLRRRNVRYKILMVKEHGHGFPANLQDYLRQGLRFFRGEL